MTELEIANSSSLSQLSSEPLYDLPEDINTQTVIQNRYSFWCHKRGKQGSGNYEEAMKQVGNFQTVEHFWRIYNHMLRPSEFKTTTDYHLFKHGIKPTWEDPQNERGGKWMVRLKKGLATRYWEELIIAIVGEQFDVGHEICGAVVSVRNNEDIISVWNKNAENSEAKNKIRDQMRRILKLPAFINVEYKKHQDSIVDKSSFRNTVVWRDNPAERGVPRKPRGDWSDRGNKDKDGGDQAGGERGQGQGGFHHRSDRSKDPSTQDGTSPRAGGFSTRFNSGDRGDREKGDKDAAAGTQRGWQHAAGGSSGTSSTWKSPRSGYQSAKDNNAGSSTSPRFGNKDGQSSWSSSGNSSSKPSPTSAPSGGGSSGWTSVHSGKTDSRTEGSGDNSGSSYVPLSNSNSNWQQGASPRARTGSNEEGGGGSAQTENVWGRAKKSAPSDSKDSGSSS